MWSSRTYHSAPRFTTANKRTESSSSNHTPPLPPISRPSGGYETPIHRPPPSTFTTAIKAAPLIQNSNKTSTPDVPPGGRGVTVNGHEFQPPSPTSDPHESGISKYVYAYQALTHFEQTCQRLGWKRIDLDASYKRTMDPGALGFTEEHADQNFKIDFYEFYQLIERALVLIQRVWGIDIDRGGSGGRNGTHNYHENVLRRLSSPDHPLRDQLGVGDGNTALWKAKELRNRWKDAATGRAATHPLRMYDVSWIVRTILDGLQAAYAPSRARMDEYFRQAVAEGDCQPGQTDPIGTGGGGSSNGAGGTQLENWDWMVVDMDMDWE